MEEEYALAHCCTRVESQTKVLFSLLSTIYIRHVQPSVHRLHAVWHSSHCGHPLLCVIVAHSSPAQLLSTS